MIGSVEISWSQFSEGWIFLINWSRLFCNVLQPYSALFCLMVRKPTPSRPKEAFDKATPSLHIFSFSAWMYFLLLSIKRRSQKILLAFNSTGRALWSGMSCTLMISYFFFKAYHNSYSFMSNLLNSFCMEVGLEINRDKLVFSPNTPWPQYGDGIFIPAHLEEQTWQVSWGLHWQS